MAAAMPPMMRMIFLVRSSSCWNEAAISVTLSMALVTIGSRSSPMLAPACFRLSSAVLNFPAAVWLRRSIAW